MGKVLLFTPRNPDSPAGYLEIAVPRTMFRDAGRPLLGKRKGTTQELSGERCGNPHQPLLAWSRTPREVTHSVED
jgi:hypothetical protein